MRILAISHMFPSAMSKRHGIFICREAQCLRKHGIETAFLVGRPWAPWPLHHVPRWRQYGPANPLVAPGGFKAEKVTYFRPPGFGFRRFDGRSLAHSLWPVAKDRHRREPFDLVLGVSMFPDAEAAVILGQKLQLPVASLAVGSDVMVYPNRMPSLRRRLCETLKRVDLPAGVSRSICERLGQTGACRREPLCIYLGSDTEQFARPKDKNQVRAMLNWPTDGVVGVYVGGLVETKGMSELAEAAEPLLRECLDFRLVCVGDGPCRDRMTALADRVGRKGAVVLTGDVTPEEVPVYLQASDFLILPSYSEGLPQAVIEAMSCGLAVVATRVGGVPEAVIHGRTGLLVEARNVEQLRTAMARMVGDGTFRLAAGQEGLARVREVFDSDRNAARFAEELKHVAGTR
ncbi:MAG TPA: glycosyltransferase [Sedimentisphaerales bacterium]|nr:glycosyltransferase [Sedimentisphaerales bacterium]